MKNAYYLVFRFLKNIDDDLRRSVVYAFLMLWSICDRYYNDVAFYLSLWFDNYFLAVGSEIGYNEKNLMQMKMPEFL